MQMHGEQIEVVIGLDGTTKLEVKGVQGQKCLDLTKDLEEQLGTVIERHSKPEMYQTVQGVKTQIKTK